MDVSRLMATVGPQSGLVPGQDAAVRINRQSGLYVAQANSALQEAVLRGNCYAAANQSGVTSQAGLSATTPVLSLYNPLGSGVNLVLWYASVQLPVACAAAAIVWLAANTNLSAAATTGTAAVQRNLFLGSANAPKGQPLLAATLPATPVAVSQIGMGLTGAITTVPSMLPLERWFNGSVIVKPGATISIQTSTASGASGLLGEFIWEEVAE